MDSTLNAEKTDVEADCTPEEVSDMLFGLLAEYAKLATVCTEPAMIAYAAAKARGLLGSLPETVQVSLSPGVLKNALSAGLPCGDRKGPAVAAALGCVIGDGKKDGKELQILAKVPSEYVQRAYRLVDKGKVTISCDHSQKGVYACVTACYKKRVARVTVSGSHTNIIEMMVDGKSLYKDSPVVQASSLSKLKFVSFESLYRACMEIDATKIEFLLEGAGVDPGQATEKESMQAPKHSVLGIEPGPSGSVLCSDLSLCSLVSHVHERVLNAISARMGGTPWPILTSGGSGNQGIVLSIPIVCAARALQKSREQTLRALYLGNAVNMYIKSHMGSISSVCGVVGASAGAAAATSWLLDEDLCRVTKSINMVLSALYGMLCDGAKASCALKGSVAAVHGLNSAFMVHKGLDIPGSEGIIGETFEETLGTLEYLGKALFSAGDELILDRVYKEGRY